MKKAVAVFLACFCAAGCGKKGPLLAPLVRVPQTPAEVTISQRGDTVLVEWENPASYTDGSPLAGGISVGIWVLEQPKSPAAAAASGTIPGKAPAPGPAESGLRDFENRAKLAASIENDRLADYAIVPGAARFSFPYRLEGRMFGAVRLAFAVRASDARSRDSEFATPVSFEPLAVPLPPGDFEIRPMEGTIELRWRAPETNIDGTSPAAVAGFNVYRESPDGRAALLTRAPSRTSNSRIGISRWSPRPLFCQSHGHEESALRRERRLRNPGNHAQGRVRARSPRGCGAGRGTGLHLPDLERQPGKDFFGYRVRRRAEGESEAGLLTPQPIADNAFTDATVEMGRVYHYSISSVDRSGNESPGTEVSVQSWKDVPQ